MAEKTLWCIHTPEDSYVATPTRRGADMSAREINDFIESEQERTPYAPKAKAAVIEWPFDAGLHAEQLVEEQWPTRYCVEYENEEQPTWRDRAPRSIADPNGPDGNPISTPIDRRWLWRIENDLAVSATTDSQHRLARDLRAYLDETCEHHYLDYEADEAWDAHRQCLWCNHIEEGQ